jgi:hypothetical protein
MILFFPPKSLCDVSLSPEYSPHYLKTVSIAVKSLLLQLVAIFNIPLPTNAAIYDFFQIQIFRNYTRFFLPSIGKLQVYTGQYRVQLSIPNPLYRLTHLSKRICGLVYILNPCLILSLATDLLYFRQYRT